MKNIDEKNKNMYRTASPAITERILMGLKKFWWLFLLIISLSAAGAFFFVRYTYRPAYQAYAALTPAVRTDNSASDIIDIAGKFNQMAEDGTLYTTLQELTGMSDENAVISFAADNLNLKVTVRASSPEIAYELLRGIKEYGASWVNSGSDFSFMLSEESGVPTKMINPPDFVSAASKGALAGAAISLLILLIYALVSGRGKKNAEYEEAAIWGSIQPSENEGQYGKDAEDPFVETAVLVENEPEERDEPKTELKKPGKEVKKPEAAVKRPEAELKKPEAVLKRPEAELKKPEAVPKRPEAELKKPEAVPKRPEAELKKPEAAVKRPKAEPKQPETVRNGADSATAVKSGTESAALLSAERVKSPSDKPAQVSGKEQSSAAPAAAGKGGAVIGLAAASKTGQEVGKEAANQAAPRASWLSQAKKRPETAGNASSGARWQGRTGSRPADPAAASPAASAPEEGGNAKAAGGGASSAGWLSQAKKRPETAGNASSGARWQGRTGSRPADPAAASPAASAPEESGNAKAAGSGASSAGWLSQARRRPETAANASQAPRWQRRTAPGAENESGKSQSAETAQIQGAASAAVPSPAEDIASAAVPSPAEDIASAAVPSPAEDIASAAVPSPAENIASAAVPSPAENIASTAVPSPAEDIASAAVPSPAEDIASAAKRPDQAAASKPSIKDARTPANEALHTSGRGGYSGFGASASVHPYSSLTDFEPSSAGTPKQPSEMKDYQKELLSGEREPAEYKAEIQRASKQGRIETEMEKNGQENQKPKDSTSEESGKKFANSSFQDSFGGIPADLLDFSAILEKHVPSRSLNGNSASAFGGSEAGLKENAENQNPGSVSGKEQTFNDLLTRFSFTDHSFDSSADESESSQSAAKEPAEAKDDEWDPSKTTLSKEMWEIAKEMGIADEFLIDNMQKI